MTITLTPLQTSALKKHPAPSRNGNFAGYFVEKLRKATPRPAECASAIGSMVDRFASKASQALSQLVTVKSSASGNSAGAEVKLGVTEPNSAKKPFDTEQNRHVNKPYSEARGQDLANAINSAFVDARFVDHKAGEHETNGSTFESCLVNMGDNTEIEIAHVCVRDMRNQIGNFEFRFPSDPGLRKIPLKDYSGSDQLPFNESPATKHWISYLRENGVADKDISSLSRICHQGLNAIMQTQVIVKPDLAPGVVLPSGGTAPITANVKDRTWGVSVVSQDRIDIEYTLTGPLAYLQTTEGETVMLDAERSSVTQNFKIELHRNPDSGLLTVHRVSGQDKLTAVTEDGIRLTPAE